jgi:hypothetical protein
MGEANQAMFLPQPPLCIAFALMQAFEQKFKDDISGFPSTSDIFFFMGPWFT